MTNVRTPARPRWAPIDRVLDLRRRSKPQLARLILVVTALIVAVVLLGWLILWLRRTSGQVAGWWVAQRAVAAPPIAYQSEDLRVVRGLRQGTVADLGAEPDTARVLDGLNAVLRRLDRRPAIVYVSAAGVAAGDLAFLLPPNASGVEAADRPGAAQRLVTVRRLIDACAARPERKVLLVLDVGQVGSDRNLGVFGNTFLHRLAEEVRSSGPPNLSVLCACAPGQTSWTSEGDGHSAFAHYVALGLAGAAAGYDPDGGRRLTVRGLHHFVAEHVARWARAHRQADQTPVLLTGPAAPNFVLPRNPTASASVPATDPQKEDEARQKAEARASELLERLLKAWAGRDALAGRQPYRHAPMLWQQYQEELLFAERLVREDQHAAADATLDALEARRRQVEEAAGGPPVAVPWSIALGREALARQPDEALKSGLDAAEAALDLALNALTASEADAPPAEPPAEEKGEEKAEAKGEKKAEGAADAGEKPAAPAEAQAARAVGSRQVTLPQERGPAVAALVDPDDEARPRFVEGQLLVWAGRFVDRFGIPDHFTGDRGRRLRKVEQLRRQAEAAAAADERVRRWFAPHVERGDELRRRVQDALFTAREAPRDEDPLGAAQAAYRGARTAAERAARALDLSAQMAAELPYLGEWRARRAARSDGPADDPEWDRALERARDLARALTGPLDAGPGDAPAPADPDVRLEELRARAAQAFEVLRLDFLARCEELGSSATPGRWREIDDALRVPLVPAEARRALLKHLRLEADAARLPAPEAAGAAAPPSSGSEGLGKTLKERGREALADKLRLSERPGEAIDLTDEGRGADPGFWRLALGLARLERDLLDLGGLVDDLAPLDDALAAARRAMESDPAQGPAAFERLSSVVRDLRARRLARLREARPTSFEALAPADRAARVLPPADALALRDDAAHRLDLFHRHAQLVWHARRLLDDYAPGHALLVLRDAGRQGLETPEAARARQRAEALLAARLSLAAEPAGGLDVADWEEHDLSLSLAAPGEVPPGEAGVVLGYDPSRPVSVADRESRRDARQPRPAPVRPAGVPARAPYLLARTEATAQAERVALAPSAFYRGHTIAAPEVVVALERAPEPVALQIAQSYEYIKHRFEDQFKEHPGRGAMHPGENLQYKLLLRAEEPQTVWVQSVLTVNGRALRDTTQVARVRLPAGKETVVPMAADHQRAFGQTYRETSGVVQSTDFPDEDVLGTSVMLGVTVRKDREDGPVLVRRQYRFEVVPYNRYIAYAVDYDETIRVLRLAVFRLSSDPVTGPITVDASVGAARQQPVPLDRGKAWNFFFQIPLGLSKVRWAIGVEKNPMAASDTLETPPPQPPAPAAAPAL